MLLQARKVSVAFASSQGTVAAVRDLSLDVLEGETLGVVGESGSGKSTLGRALLGLERLAAGHVFFDGLDLTTAPKAAMRAARRRMQPVFQDAASALDPRMVVGASIAEPLAIHSVGSRSDRRARVRALLEAVHLSAELADRLPHELSAGQRQRVNLARALALEPELLVLDEPVSALDVSVQAQLLNLLAELRAARRLTLVFISHDLEVVSHVASRVAVMYAGRVVEQGAVKDVLDAPRHPYTRTLVQSKGASTAPARATEPPSPFALPRGCAFHPACPHAIDRCRVELPELDDGPHAAACFVVK